LLVTFSISFEGVCHELDTKLQYKYISSEDGASFDHKFNEKTPSKLGMRKFRVWSEFGS
jgi:hypothetical protein